MTTELRYTPITRDALRAKFPHGGDWGIVWQGNEAVLWVCVTLSGEMTLNDVNTSVPLEEDEDIEALARTWVQATR